MKMVKSALLLSAAGLVAASGAQAADLPVKAKPVEYVKVCSLYGAGFYYIPGTDICMKVGGYVRFQQQFGDATQVTGGPLGSSGSLNNREASVESSYRSRAIATFDTRQQTAYGTLRTYLTLGATSDSSGTATNNTAGLYSNRAFIQLAGFTFGKATSFFDFTSTAAVAYNAGEQYNSDTGDGGHIVAAYTAQFGNGLSATLSAEQARRKGIDYLEVGDSIAGADLGGAAFLQDFVGNIRIDQAWGSAQVSAALHNASASYYGAGVDAGLIETNGHPGDKWGWAVAAGLRLNAPMIGPGDYFQGMFIYTEGAMKYASNTPTTMNVTNGNTLGSLYQNDGGFSGTAAAPGIYELTTAWSVFASYEHFWTPNLRTSVYGSYLDVSRPDNLNDAMCTSGIVNDASIGFTRATGCDLDGSSWTLGTRSQWNITKDLYVGLDVMYAKLNTSSFNAAGTATLAAGTGKPGGVYTVDDQDGWIATWRIHRDIVP
jgi:hypothetical protein